MDEHTVKEFLDKHNVFAVVGVSRDPQKYGHRVYMRLRDAGYTVYPVNPGIREVAGAQCYPDLKDLPSIPDVVNVVVPPKVTVQVVRTCKTLGIRKVWLQPGAESEEAISFCTKNSITVIHSVCIMVEHKKTT